MTQKQKLALALVAVLLALPSCSSDKEKADPLKVDRPADQIYNEAISALKDDQYQKAVTLFSEVERQHPYSEYATQAQLKSAEVSYEALRYDDAIISLDRFIELHPGHPQVDYAYYLKAMCYYEQMADVARDQEMTRQALEALNTVVGRFPNSSYARDAEYKRDLTLDHLAGKEMEIGRYYLKQEEVNAAINRFLAVVRNYQTTTHTPEALHRLVESYTMLGLKDEATHVAAVLGHNYPGSKWYKDSYLLLDPSQRAALEDQRSWVKRTISSLLKDE
jgi:outer membrane protein assembly factor BamD